MILFMSLPTILKPYSREIYGDKSLIQSLSKKRQELKFELRSEGYWTEEYDFEN
jgi:hypothetical protein